MQELLCLNCQKFQFDDHFISDNNLDITHINFEVTVPPDILLNNIIAIIFRHIVGDVNNIAHLRKIQESYSSIPIIIISSAMDQSIILWALRNRICDYIVLPEETEYFQKKIIDIKATKILKKNKIRRLYSSSSLQCYQNKIFSEYGAGQNTRPAIKFIVDNYKEKITTEKLALICHMSVSKFRNCFKLEHGLPPSEFIKKFRLSIAKKYLSETTHSIQQIAFSVGFEDSSYFTRTFRDTVGITPGIYRENKINTL